MIVPRGKESLGEEFERDWAAGWELWEEWEVCAWDY